MLALCFCYLSPTLALICSPRMAVSSGRLVEEEEGPLGLWATYLITGAGANVVSWLLLPPATISVGASGAVFGLFVVSVLTRVGPTRRQAVRQARKQNRGLVGMQACGQA